MSHSREQSNPTALSGRMNHPEPRTVPSHHSRGHSRDVSASASAAAALGWAKLRTSEPQTMSQNRISPSAARAASLAASATSSSPAGQARKTHAFPRTLRSGSPRSGMGNSAAAQAYKSRSPHLAPHAARGDSSSLLAAQEAVGGTRPRSVSSPILRQPVPRQTSGDSSASRGDPTTQRWPFPLEFSHPEDGAVPETTLPRDMFTANPPVEPEVEEKRKAEELRVSAVAMAKEMFKQQPRLAESILREDDSQSIDEPGQFEQHPNLHEAAYKLAQKRLAKIHEENQRNRELEANYRASGVLRRRWTIADRLRGRTSSDSALEPQHRDRASNRSSLLGPEKSEADVLEAARKNVQSQLDDIDRTVGERTGMVPPSRRSAWHSRARAVAQAKSAAAAAPAPHDGRRDVGGGLYVPQEDIEAVAKQNLKPLLLEMDERAEKERERMKALGEEAWAKRVEAERKEAYEKDVKDTERKLKADQKAKDKERQKVLKDEERARKREEKAEKKKRAGKTSTVVAPDMNPTSPPTSTTALPSGRTREDSSTQNNTQLSGGLRRTSGNSEDGGSKEQTFSPGKMKSWIRAKLTRQKPATKDRDDSELGRGFMGGHTFRSPEISRQGTASSSSVRDVALAGRTPSPRPESGAQTPIQSQHEEGGGPLQASPATDDTFEDAMERVSPPRTPPRIVAAGKSGSPMRDSRFVEMMD